MTSLSERTRFVANWLENTPLWRLEPDDIREMAKTLHAVAEEIEDLEVKNEAGLHGIAHGQAPYVAAEEAEIITWPSR